MQHHSFPPKNIVFNPSVIVNSQEKGVEVVACISVNDPFVMAAWGEAHKCEGKVSKQL